FNPERPLTLYSCNNADRLPFELEDWTLLDMGLNERGRLCSERPARQRWFGRQDFVQRSLDRDPGLIANAEDLVELADAAKARRPHHARCEPRALLVHPRHHFDGSARTHTARNDRFDRLQGRQDAEGTVELAAGRLTVDVRSNQDSWQGGICARIAE